MMGRWRSFAGIAVLALSLVSTLSYGQERSDLDFQASKKVLRKIWNQHRIDGYCGCTYTESLDVSSDCGFVPAKESKRAHRIEWEHVVAAADYGRQRACWREAGSSGGREYCRENDPVFRAMEGDPINLMPVVGSLNAYRSDYRYGEVPGEAREYGSCDFEMSPAGSGDRFVEPPAAVKGDVARVYFYFEQRYGHRIAKSQRRLFDAWDRMDPIDAWERERYQLIATATGFRNEVVLAAPMGSSPQRPRAVAGSYSDPESEAMIVRPSK